MVVYYTCKNLTAICFFVSFGIVSVYGQQNSYSPDIENKINLITSQVGSAGLLARMAFYHVKGINIAVINNYHIDWARGFGSSDAKGTKEVMPDTRFQAGSISKSVNAAGVMKLVEARKLDLNQDINAYYKAWQFPYDNHSGGQKITTINLLSHTAGLNVHGFNGYAQGAPIPNLLQILNGRPPANSPAVRSQFPPGVRFQYSGGGIMLTQLLIVNITGMRYENYMEKDILAPMGMTNSSYDQPPQAGVLSSAFDQNGTEIDGQYHIYPEKAAAGLWTTPSDLAKFIIQIQLSLRGDSSVVLSQQTAKLMTTPYIGQNNCLGLFTYRKGGVRYFGHDGVNAGFVSIFYGSFSGGNGIVVMSNTASKEILDEIVKSIAQVYGWDGF